MMTHSNDTPNSILYDKALVLAFELIRKSWGLAAQVHGLPRSSIRKTIPPEKQALEAAIDGYRARAVATGHLLIG